jgi:hypothetical protein
MKQILIAILLISISMSCKTEKKESIVLENKATLPSHISTQKKLITKKTIRINRDVTTKNYFEWMDSLVQNQNKVLPYGIDEYLLVHHNPWIMDSLAHTDYYYLKDLGVFSEDPQAITILPKGKTLNIPDSLEVRALKDKLSNTYLDVNIPEFKLRIIQDGIIQYEFPVRVGKNGRQYLAMAKRDVDLRTKPGIGKIVRVNKSPSFINPKDNHRYYTTKRDDEKVTKLPRIPWIEPEINGSRFGQLIHPTTNMATLGKPVSNGCIGLREADAWRVYYFAPLGTKVVLRYELEINVGDSIARLNNIYPGFENKSYRKEALEEALKNIDGKPVTVCDCGIAALVDKK